MRLLLLEDAPGDAALVKRYLNAAEVLVDVAPSLTDGIVAVLSREYSAVITDLGLPDAEGPDAVKALRAVADPRVPVIVVSGTVDPAAVRSAIRAGANDFVSKDSPTLGEDIVSSVERWRELGQLSIEEILAGVGA